MLRIRVVKTASGANAVQVVFYRNRKRFVFKHIGSASSSHELESLKLIAQNVIKNFNPEIKGYCTNLDESAASNQTIIERYHELYRVEQAFRISKYDLQIRPIFHFKE